MTLGSAMAMNCLGGSSKPSSRNSRAWTLPWVWQRQRYNNIDTGLGKVWYNGWVMGHRTMDYYQRQMDASDIYQFDAFLQNKWLVPGSHGFIVFVREVDRDRVRIFHSTAIRHDLGMWQNIDPASFILLWAKPAYSNDLVNIQHMFSKYRIRADWYEYSKCIYEFVLEGKYGRVAVENEFRMQSLRVDKNQKRVHGNSEWFK